MEGERQIELQRKAAAAEAAALPVATKLEVRKKNVSSLPPAGDGLVSEGPRPDLGPRAPHATSARRRRSGRCRQGP